MVDTREHSEDREKIFDVIRFNKNPDSKLLSDVFAHVVKFIIKNKMILTGGMAIDAALRLKGSKLYPDDVLPDYDCMSPDHITHASLLASELCNLGFPDVSVGIGMHYTTMKVRVKENEVADITFCPRRKFDTTETLTYKGGMKIIHPYHSLKDFFNMLTFPFQNPPMEVIFHKWPKVIDRINLILQYYPIVSTSGGKLQSKKANTKRIKHKTRKQSSPAKKVTKESKQVTKGSKQPKNPKMVTEKPNATFEIKSYEVKLPTDDTDKYVLHGWSALAYYNSHFPSLTRHTSTNLKTGTLSLPVPYNTIATESIDLFRKTQQHITYFYTLMGYPRHFETETLHVYDTQGYKMTVLNDGQLVVASLPALMLHFMQKWLVSQDPLDKQAIDNTYELMQSGQWKLDVATYGTYDWNMPFLFNVRLIHDQKEMSAIPKGIRNINKSAKNCTQKIEFAQSSSIYFRIDGSPSPPFEPLLNLDWIKIRDEQPKIQLNS